jgi:copper chaperone CopZ
MKKTLYSMDIECDSCVKVIERVMGRLPGINSYVIKKNSLLIDYDESLIKVEAIVKSITEKGYRVFDQPITRKRIRTRLKDFVKDKSKYQLEYRFMKYVFGTLFILVVLQFIYAAIRGNLTNFFTPPGVWLFYLTLTVVGIGGAMWHFKAYRGEVTSMVGMMIGMIIGMQTGMMLGPILAATVGFSISATVSMIAGSIVGALMGKCCGIMGLIQGVMSGIMGGIMGAMIGMMMGKDLVWFLPLYLGLNFVVIVSMVIMVFEEIVEGKEYVRKNPLSFWKFFVYSLLVLIFLTALIQIFTPAMAEMGAMAMGDSMAGMTM